MSNHYNKHSIRNKKPISSFTTDWHHSEGVFETPQRKFIARVKKLSKTNTTIYHTISQHNTREEAQTAFNQYKNKHNE